MGMTDGLEARRGTLTVPNSPGLGIELDEGVIEENRSEGEPYWE